MGWLFTKYQTKEELIDRCLRGDSHPTGFKALAHTISGGNRLWVVFENEANEHLPKGERFIALYLLASQRGFGWGYKDMDESVGPAYYDCPLSYLKMAPDPKSEYSAGWREKVREYHVSKVACRAKFKALRVGDMIRSESIRPNELIVTEVGRTVFARSLDGRRFRVPPRVIRNAEIISAV